MGGWSDGCEDTSGQGKNRETEDEGTFSEDVIVVLLQCWQAYLFCCAGVCFLTSMNIVLSSVLCMVGGEGHVWP